MKQVTRKVLTAFIAGTLIITATGSIPTFAGTKTKAATFDSSSFTKVIKANGNKNTVYSPLSVKFCLAIAMEGAGSGVKKEMENALGTTANIEKLYKNNKGIKDTAISNSLWADNGLTINDETRKNIASRLDADIFSADLQSAGIVKKVNNYVKENTNGFIPVLINEPYADSVKAVLMNTVYMKGTWTSEFDKYSTYDDNFNGKNVPTMHQTEHFNYAKKGKLKCVELPYTNGMSMYIVEPVSKKNDILKIWNSLSAANKEKVANGKYFNMADTNIELSMPKFTTNSDLALTDTLKALGINRVFTTKNALPNIAKDLHISEVQQVAKIKCDEKGTEAAAVTQAILETTSIAEPELTVKFAVDRPFMYFIRDNKSNSTWFMGYIVAL